MVLVNPTARYRQTDDYEEWADVPHEALEVVLEAVRERRGTSQLLRFLAPSAAGDARFERWLTQCERLSMPPQDAYWRFRASYEVDVRHLLPAIRVPTLVVVRAGWRGYEQGRYVSEQIDGARYVELAGKDYWFFAGDTGPLVDAIEEFVTGRFLVMRSTGCWRPLCSPTLWAPPITPKRWAIAAGRSCSPPTTLSSGPSSSGSAVERSRRPATGSWRPSTGRAEPSAAHAAIHAAVQAIGINVHVGLHTGEIELRGDDIGGIAVHTAQRVMALAQPNEVLVSRTVADLIAGSGIPVADRGTHTLKGVDMATVRRRRLTS